MTPPFDALTKAKQFAFLAAHEKSPEGDLYYVGDVVEDVRTVFEQLDDASIYIPSFITSGLVSKMK